MFQRQLYEWLRRHPYVFDASLASVLLLLSVGLAGDGTLGAPLLAVGQFVPLVWRRRFPAAVFTVVSLTCFAQVLIGEPPGPVDIGFLFALYAVSAYSQRRWARFGSLAVGALGAVLGAGMLTVTPTIELVIVVGSLGAPAALTWTLGDLMRTRRAYIGELEERARRLEFERDQQGRIASAAERARIARELHDVVAHSLSIVIAQADGGSYAAAQDPKAAKNALETIGVTGRKALAEMRRLLGVLRTDGERSGFAPQPDLGELDDLVAQIRASGLAVQVQVDGERAALPSGAELAAYRIVQESLTNTLKHGGPSVTAFVRVTYGEDLLRLSIVDDGRGAAATNDGQGQGLRSMRERAALYGGTLTARPRTGGGFEVLADLPMAGIRDTTGEEPG